MAVIGDFLAFTKILADSINTKLNGLADGTLDDDANKLSIFRLEEQVDHVISGLGITSTGYVVTITQGFAKIGGKRVSFATTSLTAPTAANNVYIDAKDDGTFTLITTATGAAAPALTVSAIRLFSGVTAATGGFTSTNIGQNTPILSNGVRVYPQGAIHRNQLRSGELNLYNIPVGTVAPNTWNAYQITIPNGMSMRSSSYHVSFSVMGEGSGGGQGAVRLQPGIGYSQSTTQFVVWIYSSLYGANVTGYISASLKEKDNY